MASPNAGNRVATERWACAGHFVASLDLPAHGDRVDPAHGESLDGWASALLAGDDPFVATVSDASALVSECLVRGYG